MAALPIVWVAPVASLGGALFGAALAAWTTAQRERSKRHHAFRERQLRELYSPLLGIRSEIRLRSQLRSRISEVASSEWRQLCEHARNGGGDSPEAMQKLEAERWPAFERVIDYSNQQLRQDLMPAYRKMVETFRANIWLAESDTRTHFDTLVEFVAIWEQWLADSIPHEVIVGLGHSDAMLTPFYDHIQKKHDELCNRLTAGYE